MLNHAGNSFKKLPPESKDDLNEATAKHLMLAQPSKIKRPIVVHQRLFPAFATQGAQHTASEIDVVGVAEAVAR